MLVDKLAGEITKRWNENIMAEDDADFDEDKDEFPYEDMIVIYKAAILEAPCPIDSPEARALYQEFRAEIDDPANEGKIWDIPHDWPG